MNRRFFLLLCISAALLILAVLGLNWLGPQKADTASREKLLPALASERAGIDHIQLSNAGKALIELKRNGEQWIVANRDGYAANAGKIRTLLDNLSQADKAEAKTADPARYDKLGVNDDSDKSLLLKLGAGDRVVAELVVGNAVVRPAGHFVRVKGDAQSWLIDRELSIGKEITDWLRTDLLMLPATQIKQIERLKAQPVQCIQAPCLPVPAEREFALTKEKAEDNEFVLSPLPKGKEKGAAWLLSGLSDALNGLTATDVFKQSAFDFSKSKVTFSRYTSFDDQVVLLSHYGKDSKHYISLTAEAGPAATDEVKKTVADLNSRHTGWLYEISSYKGEGLARDLNALVQDKKSVN